MACWSEAFKHGKIKECEYQWISQVLKNSNHFSCIRSSCIYGPISDFGPNELKILYHQVVIEQSRKFEPPQQEYRCKKCKFAKYCSRNCLMKDWKNHKLYCLDIDRVVKMKKKADEALEIVVKGAPSLGRMDLRIRIEGLFKEKMYIEEEYSRLLAGMAVYVNMDYLWTELVKIMWKVLEMDILTGTGEVLTVTGDPQDPNRDLFFAFPNSYGSLGYALRLKIELEPTQPFVHISHLRFDSAEELTVAMKDLVAKSVKVLDPSFRSGH
jgi:hypothetical protein